MKHRERRTATTQLAPTDTFVFALRVLIIRYYFVLFFLFLFISLLKLVLGACVLYGASCLSYVKRKMKSVTFVLSHESDEHARAAFFSSPPRTPCPVRDSGGMRARLLRIVADFIALNYPGTHIDNTKASSLRLGVIFKLFPFLLQSITKHRLRKHSSTHVLQLAL